MRGCQLDNSIIINLTLLDYFTFERRFQFILIFLLNHLSFVYVICTSFWTNWSLMNANLNNNLREASTRKIKIVFDEGNAWNICRGFKNKILLRLLLIRQSWNIRKAFADKDALADRASSKPRFLCTREKAIRFITSWMWQPKTL